MKEKTYRVNPANRVKAKNADFRINGRFKRKRKDSYRVNRVNFAIVGYVYVYSQKVYRNIGFYPVYPVSVASYLPETGNNAIIDFLGVFSRYPVYPVRKYTTSPNFLGCALKRAKWGEGSRVWSVQPARGLTPRSLYFPKLPFKPNSKKTKRMNANISISDTPPKGLVFLTCRHSTPDFPIVWVSPNNSHKVTATQARMETYCLEKHGRLEAALQGGKL